METTPQKIMDALQSGLSQPELVARFPGGTLSPEEMEELFTQAKCLGRSQVAHRLLVYLIQVSKDEWFNVRVLALLVQHARDSAHDQTERLIAMRKILDRLAKTLPETGDEFAHYQKLNAFYYVLAARSRREVGDMDRAQGWYENALGIYRSLGLDSSVEKVAQEIQTLIVERRAFAVTSTFRETVSPNTGSVIDLDAADGQPEVEITEPNLPEAEPLIAEPSPFYSEDQRLPEASRSVPAEPQPALQENEPAPAEPQPISELDPPVSELLQPACPDLPQDGPGPAAEIDPVATTEEIRLLSSRRDALQIEVQDLGQQCDSLQAQASKTQKRLKGLETRVKEQQRILEEKKALLQQMDRLSEQEARLRQNLALLEKQEQEQTRRLETLYSEARLLEKQVEVLKRYAAPPLMVAKPEMNQPENP